MLIRNEKVDKMKVEEIRKDFPILTKREKPLIYLDNAATTLKPRQVISAINEYYQEYTANVHRAIYKISQKATEAYEDAREKIAKFINAQKTSEIIFTKGTTEAINLVAYGLKWEAGDEIITTIMEHHSNIVPWQIIQRKFGIKIKYVGLEDNYKLDLNQLEKYLTEKTRLVAVTHVSNMLGTINPIREITEIAHKIGALVLVDAAQSTPHMLVDVKELGCDFLAFSGHKMLGPTGIGVLYIGDGIEDYLDPPFGGGEMIKKVTLGGCTWNDMPWRFEPGTPNIAGAIGLAAAIDYLSNLEKGELKKHEENLVKLTINQLEKISEKIEIYGSKNIDERCGIVSFNIEGIDSHDVALLLDELSNIAVRSGLHCTEPLHRFLGIKSSVRASFYIYNTEEEVNMLCNTLREIMKTFA